MPQPDQVTRYRGANSAVIHSSYAPWRRRPPALIEKRSVFLPQKQYCWQGNKGKDGRMNDDEHEEIETRRHRILSPRSPRLPVPSSPCQLFILHRPSFRLHPFLVAWARVRRNRSLAPKNRMAVSAKRGTKAARRRMAQIRKRVTNCCR